MITVTGNQMEVLKSAIKTFGKKSQYEKAVEETTELNLQIIHGQNRGFDQSEMQSEIADGLVMLFQLAEIHGAEQVQTMLDFKIDRLQDRIRDFQELDI